MKYRPEIDGLRALAVVPVILFHAGFEFFSGGFVGVDVFFVISGYLITTILIEDIENNRFSLVSFYERRVRRMFPALFFVMLVCIPFAWIWMTPNQMTEFSKSLVAVSLFASNIYFWQKSDYFGTVTEETPVEMPQKEASNNTFDPLKTTITLAKDTDDDKSNVAAQRRKLRGWLVTFDLISFGTDFKIIEGRNTIGKNADNAITIKDSEVSGSHAMILCRNDVFEISDEMSTNGTTVNGTELGSRLPHILSDGDKIKIGTTNLLFRKAF